jgi:anti-sigma regulatory factor (Ser/Thr protein kinase)
VLCPYDAYRLAGAVLADAERTHPVVTVGGVRRASPRYTAPQATMAAFNRPLPEPGTIPAMLAFDAADLSAVRRFVAVHAGGAGLGRAACVDLQLAVNEVATNAVVHGGGPGTVRIWADRRAVVCEVSDPGRFTDPLAGRIPPDVDSEHGRGLVLVNYLCDLVQIHTDRSGTTIRLHMRR